MIRRIAATVLGVALLTLGGTMSPAAAGVFPLNPDVPMYKGQVAIPAGLAGVPAPHPTDLGRAGEWVMGADLPTETLEFLAATAETTPDKVVQVYSTRWEDLMSPTGEIDTVLQVERIGPEGYREGVTLAIVPQDWEGWTQ